MTRLRIPQPDGTITEHDVGNDFGSTPYRRLLVDLYSRAEPDQPDELPLDVALAIDAGVDLEEHARRVRALRSDADELPRRGRR